MKILKRNMKKQKVVVMIETPEDLWHIENVLEPGDLVTSKTMRKTSIKRGGEYEYGEKKPMVLTIEVEKVEFKKDSGVLRLTGQIVSGPEDVERSYHSIQVDVSSVLTIKKKRWRSFEMQRLEKAKVRKPLLLICVLDREDAEFAVLKESGIEMKAKITNKDKENTEAYHKRIMSYLSKQDFGTIVLAGPGFERENLLAYIRKNDKDLAGKIMLEHTSSTGITGIQEVIKKSTNRVMRETRIAKEAEYVTEILKRIKTDGLVVYGPKETGNAVNSGAVEILFVSQEKVRDFEKLMEAQEKMRGEIAVIGSDHETGEQFLHLGGIAGFLRYRLDF